MELSNERPSLNPNQGHVFRRSPVGDLVGTLAAFGALAGGGFALSRLWGEVPGLMWFVIGPTAFFAGGITLVVAFALLGTLRSSLKPTNWLAFVVPEGVHLNLRSYRNGHFAVGAYPTVAFLSFREMESAGQVTETRREGNERKEFTREAKTIELRTRVDTQPLANACWAERNQSAPEAKFLGITSQAKHHDAPVYVPAPGIVRVEWNEGLYAQFLRHLVEAEPREVDLDAELGVLPPEERAYQLLLRGEKFAAIRMAKEALKLSSREAEAWVQDVAKRAA